MRPALLEVKDVSLSFGGIVALDSVSFAVNTGEICGLIGPNGAGKTTLFNCLSRLYRQGRGTIHFDGADLAALPRHAMAPRGIGRTFQNLALFGTLSVRQNVLVGGHCRTKAGFLASALRLRRVAAEEARLAREVDDLVDFLELDAVRDRLIGDLPFGIQKRVELARALATRPKLLLLDEPAGGLNHEEVEELKGIIRQVRDRLGVTVLLIEHHMNMVMTISDHVVALDFGQKIADGVPSAVQHDAAVIQAYLGGSA